MCIRDSLSRVFMTSTAPGRAAPSQCRRRSSDQTLWPCKPENQRGRAYRRGSSRLGSPGQRQSGSILCYCYGLQRVQEGTVAFVSVRAAGPWDFVARFAKGGHHAVSYTHLTLPTIYSV